MSKDDVKARFKIEGKGTSIHEEDQGIPFHPGPLASGETHEGLRTTLTGDRGCPSLGCSDDEAGQEMKPFWKKINNRIFKVIQRKGLARNVYSKHSFPHPVSP